MSHEISIQVSLFLAKENDKPLRALLDYQGLNRITRRSNASLPRSNDIFDKCVDV